VYWTAGGGGRIAIYYQTLTLDRTKITAAGGLSTGNPTRTGAAGTVYLRQNDVSGAKVVDELVLDNLARTPARLTTLASIGTGTVSAVSGAVVTLSNPVPEWIEGSTLELLGASGTQVSSYEIVSRTTTTATLRLGSGETSANVAVGNTYRGTWRFSQVTARGEGMLDSAGLRTSLITTTGTNSVVRVGELRGDDVILRGRMEANGIVETKSLALQSTLLTHSLTTDTTINRLTVKVDGAMTVDATSTIDVTGRGFTGTAAGYGRTWPNTTAGGSYNGAGGSHGGRGGQHDAYGDSAAAYGSVFDPNEPGGSGGYYFNGNCNPCNAGGGIARLTAKSLVLDGKVLSNGVMSSGTGSGAGGSIRIDVETLSGAGELHADGAPVYWTAGGGGRIAIYYRTLTLDRTKITAAGGLSTGNPTRTGAAGTVYFRQTDATGAKVLDELVIDNLGRPAARLTTLPAIGTGTVTAVNGAVVTLSSPVPEWIEGTTLEFLDAAGTLVSSYEIVSRTATTATLRLGSGETVANVAVGNTYRGTWRIDQLTARGEGMLESSGGLRMSLIATTGTNSFLRFGDVRGDDVILRGRIEANGVVETKSLALQNGAVLTHTPTTDTTINRLTVKVEGTITVDATSAIDVTGRGFTGSTAGFGRTWPNTTTGGSYNGAGGSHGGRGGQHDAYGDSAPTYGSVFDPNEPGSAGGYYSNGTCNPCNSGGGIARLTAKSLVLDGKVLSNGVLSSGTGSGAGGSIRIDVETLSGAGEIHADGAPVYWTAGGGGRIAIYYQTLTLDRTKITAAGGLSTGNPTRTGAAGTIYFKQTAQAFGDLTVDNLGRSTIKSTGLSGVGYATITDLGTDFLKDATAQFLAPDHLRGVRAVVNYDRTKSWPILSNDNKILRLDVTGQPLVAETGQLIRGLYKFDNVKLRNAKLDTIDLLEVTNPIDKDAPSSVVGNNQARPLLNASLISLQSTPTGAAVVGSAGAVTDLDTPITAIATNTVTGNVYQVNVNDNGSFAVGVQGNTGNAINFKARDGNVYQLESPTIPVGNLSAPTPVPSQIPKTDWTSDTSFLPRTLAHDGAHLAVASYPTGNGASGTLVILGVSDPAHPALIRALNVGIGTIKDVAVSNGWAFIAANRFATLNLTDPAATANLTNDQGGEENGVEVVGGYAFTAESGSYYNDGRIHVYDVSTPSSPRYIRSQGVLGGGIHFTDLIALGTEYLIALTPDKTGTVGHDVVVIDRRDINNLTRVADIDIPNFDAFRGAVFGTKLYVASTTAAQFVVVDLANPTAPVVLGSAALPAGAGGVAVVGPDAFAAGGASGLLTLDVTNALPVLTGTTPVSGNAFDVDVIGPYVYVANETGIALIPAQAAPQVSLSRIKMTLDGTSVMIIGASQSVTGSMPLTIDLTNTNTNNKILGLAVQTDGSFTSSLPATAGDRITIKATDASGRSTGPLSLGGVPFGSQTTSIPITTAMADSSFLARNIATDGNHLVVTGYFDSDKIVLFDVTNRANPVYKRAVPTSAGSVRDVAVRNGWAFIAANRFMSLNLTDPAATPVYTGDPGGEDNGLAVVGSYAFTAESGSYYNDGRIHIYDISTPSAPRYIRSEGLVGGGIHFTGLAALGTDYLIAVTQDKTSGTGHDVVVVDRRDINDLKDAGEVDIPNFEPFRVTAVGTTAYVTGTTGIAVIDVADPAKPKFLRFVQTPGYPYSIAPLGSILAVADGSAGATFLDISNPDVPVVLGNQVVGGNAWDCALNGATLYIANEQGIAVIDGLGTPPLIDRSLITTSTNGATTATVIGSAKAILGLGPLTAELRNATTNVSVPGIAVAADGSFSTTITGASGDLLTLKATDRANRVSGPVSLGSVPFGSVTRQINIDTSMSDSGFLARNVAADGNDVVVADYFNSDKIVIFDGSTPGNPVYERKVATGAGAVRDLTVSNGWAFIVANRFMTLNLSDPAATPIYTGDPGGEEQAVEVVGGYAFTAEGGSYYNDARIHIYDVSSPSSPRYISSQGMLGGGIHFTGLAAMGTDYLIGVTTDKTSGIGHDVMVIDRRDLNVLRRIADLDIPNFEPYRVKAIGNIAYVTGVNGGVAVVDLTNPAAPRFDRFLGSLGAARGIDSSGNIVVVANGTNGVGFIDGSSTPYVIGSHPVPSAAWDVALSRGAMYVATDFSLTAISNVAVPPMVNESLLTVTPTATSTTVTGAPQAVSGIVPVTARVTNIATATSSPAVTVNGDGSFSATVNAVPGQPLTMSAIDVAGRMTTRNLAGTYGATTTRLANQIAANDGNFRARRVASDANMTLVSSGTLTSGDTLSSRFLLFRQPNASEPPQIVTAGAGDIRDIEISSGYAFIAGTRFGTINLSDPSLATHLTTDQGGEEGAVAVSGQYAFTTEVGSYYNDGRIHIYDISNPSSPVYVRSQGLLGGGMHYHGLVAVGASYLIAISNERPGNVDHDVMIIDRSNINDLKKTAEVQIANFDPQDAVVDGTTLYVTGGDRGVAIIDITNPFDPKFKTIIDTPGLARGIAISGPNEIVVADSSGAGLTFIDVTDKSNPMLTGTQRLTGSVMDVRVVGRVIHVVAENYYHMILRP
jgi:hypothetical protein